MKLESIGIIIHMQPFGEKDAVAHVFTKDFGVLVGLIRGAARARPQIMTGQFGHITWNARLEQQLGVFHFESDGNLIAPIMSNLHVLPFVNSAFALLQNLLPEREGYEHLYEKTEKMLRGMSIKSDVDKIYLEWEIYLLCELGYALDLESCGGCGTTDNLQYISPKTGHAVCDKCGAPYSDKLLLLPVDLKITRFFLTAITMEMGQKSLPMARVMLEENN